MNKKITDIIDTLFYSLFYIAQNLIRVSAAAPILFLIFYLALHGDKDPATFPALTPLQTILTAIKCTAPLTLIFLPFYDAESRRQHNTCLTKIGLISYTIAWSICFIATFLLPSSV